MFYGINSARMISTDRVFLDPNNLRFPDSVNTDEFRAYNGLGASGYTHKTVRHSAGEYVRDMAHTNGIESFWSLLKRGYIGVYHYMSEKHLHRYVDEFSHRHNTSKVGTIAFIGGTIDKMQGKRLTYKELIADAK